MNKIEAGWYRSESEGFDVYISHKRVYTGYNRKYDNRSVPSYRTDRYWSYNILANGLTVYGFGTKKQAIDAAREHLKERAKS